MKKGWLLGLAWAAVGVLAIWTVAWAADAPAAVELKPEDVQNVKGDGPDGKGNTDDDTWGFWFELIHDQAVYRRLHLATATMTPDQRQNGIRDPKARRGAGKVRGPIGAYLPNPKDTEGWIFSTDWDGRYEGVWGDKKDNCIIVHPYTEKTAAGAVAITYTVKADGDYAVSAKLTDLTLFDGGDGVKWRIEIAEGEKRASVVAESKPFGDKVGPASVDLDVKKVTAKKGQLIRLVIDPNKHWGTDMTKIEGLKVTPAGAEAPKADEKAPADEKPADGKDK